MAQQEGTDAVIDAGVAALAARARHDLARLNYPPANWVPPGAGPDGAPLLDVLVVGGGMCGQTATFALLREGVRNLRCIDRAARGREGPWATYARMDTLRSPKHLTGPDLGVASLTYRAWHEARFGAAGWESLGKIPRLDWAEYLLWVRDTAQLPVENEVELRLVELLPGAVRAHLRDARGERVVHARKVILALGRDGSGAARWPAFASFAPGRPHAAGRVFHASDDIDFRAFAGARIGVLGAGASAFDNAGEALDAGAAAVTLFARRVMLPQVNKSKWTSFPGFQHGYASLDDAQRWRFYTYIFNEQVPPPWESIQRCDRHAAFALRFDAGWHDILPDADGVTVQLSGAAGAAPPERFDAVVVATGFDVDLVERPELASFRNAIRTWRQQVPAEAADANPEAARFPYLGDVFQLLERDPGAVPGIGRVHLFNWGSTMSHGALAGDIPGIDIGARRLAQGVVRDLFVADADLHRARMLVHDEDELKPTRYWVPRESR